MRASCRSTKCRFRDLHRDAGGGRAQGPWVERLRLEPRGRVIRPANSVGLEGWARRGLTDTGNVRTRDAIQKGFAIVAGCESDGSHRRRLDDGAAYRSGWAEAMSRRPAYTGQPTEGARVRTAPARPKGTGRTRCRHPPAGPAVLRDARWRRSCGGAVAAFSEESEKEAENLACRDRHALIDARMIPTAPPSPPRAAGGLGARKGFRRRSFQARSIRRRHSFPIEFRQRMLLGNGRRTFCVGRAERGGLLRYTAIRRQESERGSTRRRGPGVANARHGSQAGRRTYSEEAGGCPPRCAPQEAGGGAGSRLTARASGGTVGRPRIHEAPVHAPGGRRSAAVRANVIHARARAA